MTVEIRTEEDPVQALSYVEIIVHLDDIDPNRTYEALLARGRQAIGPLKTMLDRWSALPASQRPDTRQRLGGVRPAASAS